MKKELNLTFISSIVVTIILIIAYLLGEWEFHKIAGGIVIFGAILLFLLFYTTSQDILNTRGIFLLAWLGSNGLSLLQLHKSQENWKIETWIVIWGSTVFMLFGFFWGLYNKGKRFKIMMRYKVDFFSIIIVFSAIIVFFFIVETVASGGLPIFSNSMSAYLEFGLSYIHYITVSCVLIPPMTVLYLNEYRVRRKRLVTLFLINIIMFAIPVLIVSRQLLLLQIVITFMTYFEIHGFKFKMRHLVAIVAVLVGAWIMLSMFRNQSDEYLRIVLQLDNNQSVPFYQFYMYIAFNIDTFNANVGNILHHTLGTQMLYPLLTLTGLKKIIPESLMTIDVNMITTTFNTSTFLTPAYADFGVIGNILFAIVIGSIAGSIEKKRKKKNDRKYILMHVLMDYAFMFTFFVSFFANTSIWIYFIMIYLIDLFGKKETVLKK